MKNNIKIITDPEENVLRELHGCGEENEPVFYCQEYTNFYCPHTCSYAIKKFQDEKRKLEVNNETMRGIRG